MIWSTRKPFYLGFLSLLWLSACGGVAAVTPEDVSTMKDRMAELERSNGRYRVRIEELEERVFLLQDRVDAARLTLERQRTGAPSHDIRVPGAGYPQPSGRDTASSGDFFPQLPVVTLDPARPQAPAARRAAAPAAPLPPVVAASPEPANNANVPEVVVDEGFYQKWLATSGSRDARAPAKTTAMGGGGGGGGGQRKALPPVVTNGDRLPAATQDASPVAARGPAEAAPAPAPVTAPLDGSPLVLYRTSLDAFNQGRYADAKAGLQKFVASGPADDYLDNAFFWLGECAYGEGRYDDALGLFQKVVSEYADGNKVPDALLKVALSYERLQQLDRTKEVLAQLAATYPSTDAARRATERMRALQ
jgi:tol-pal system protein YbgF